MSDEKQNQEQAIKPESKELTDKELEKASGGSVNLHDFSITKTTDSSTSPLDFSGTPAGAALGGALTGALAGAPK